MVDRKQDTDPLPERFSSAEAAGEFWDTHELTDYEEYLEPADMEIDIQRRHFAIEVDEDCFTVLRDTAKRQGRPVMELASEILKRGLGAL